jgi:uncharacterized protein
MATPSPVPPPEQPIRLVTPPEALATGPLAAEPSLIALPSFLVGAVAFGMVLIGVVPTTVVGAAMPIVLTAGLGMWVAAIWSARIGQSAPAGISAIVGGFFVSYALLVLGLIHNWFGIPLTAITDTQKLFTISWLVIVTMLVLATLRMPSVFTLLFALVDVALLVNLLSIIQTSANLSKAAGWVVMAASAVVVYLFFSSASHATGGKELPLGPPILHA